MARNVLGEKLQECSRSPLTGFFRDGCCNTGKEDLGLHLVCAEVTAEFVFAQAWGRSMGGTGGSDDPQFRGIPVRTQ